MKIFILFLILSALNVEAQTLDEFYADLNKVRKSRLMKPLLRSTELESQAGVWLAKMQEKYGKLVHDRSSKSAEVLTNCQYPLQCWLESKPHRKILLSRRYRRIGVAYLKGNWCARLN